MPIEIKSGETIIPSFFKSLEEWSKISGSDPEFSTIIYGGDSSQSRRSGKILGWKQAGQFISQL